ncbi:MAG: metal ABC transporter ATP-binding protein [Verrucomicrobiales bacterium]
MLVFECPERPTLFLGYSGRKHLDPVAEEPALRCEGLGFYYPHAAMPALDNVSLQVTNGSRVALVGPNGAGKSTLLKLAAGLLRPQTGVLAVAGNPAGACHHRTAYLEQRSEVDWSFPVRVEQMVMSGRFVHLGWLRRPRTKDQEVVEEALGLVDLLPLRKRLIQELSGGQQQRVLLARALAQGASILLFDEPLNAVDHQTRDLIFDLLNQLKQQGHTVIMATHDVGRLASDFDEVYHFEEGRLIQGPHAGQDASCEQCHPSSAA